MVMKLASFYDAVTQVRKMEVAKDVDAEDDGYSVIRECARDQGAREQVKVVWSCRIDV